MEHGQVHLFDWAGYGVALCHSSALISASEEKECPTLKENRGCGYLSKKTRKHGYSEHSKLYILKSYTPSDFIVVDCQIPLDSTLLLASPQGSFSGSQDPHRRGRSAPVWQKAGVRWTDGPCSRAPWTAARDGGVGAGATLGGERPEEKLERAF
ncbi:hypothetical protein DPEC_G00255010 [Dallia pectoralis]|uniref:Uncharacterized protein n=1 Tax=Dallia pectoralis TaxID=75939 RepID=A0ACC2FUK1_DALPE|nr:hypothetical protein DPEC_G00255010 [Dallia pectoralis]